MKTGIQQLREEKYRFTVETQGLSYTTKHRQEGTQDDDTAWTDDNSDREDAPKRKTSPLAQRMASELTRVLREGAGQGFTDDALEQLLAGTLQSGSDVAGYDVAKDYIKQVFGQLYGGGDYSVTSSISAAGQVLGDSRNPKAPAPGLHAPPNQPSSTSSSSGGGSIGASQALTPPSRTPNPQPHGGRPLSTATPAITGVTPPPWTAAVARGSVAGVAAEPVSAAAAGGPDDELERPRPRPHHGRIKEQLELLHHADQLAAIISVATTAATTAAAAAMKQAMQTPPPLPPGAYARMHAAGEPVYSSFPVATAGRASQVAAAAAARARGAPGGAIVAGPQAATEGLGDESPDPQPQQRQGALVSPHRRSTPMVVVMGRRQDGDGRAGGAAEAPAADQEEPGDGSEADDQTGPAMSEIDGRALRQRPRWSQLRGEPLGPPGPIGTAGAGRVAAGPTEAGTAGASGNAASGSNLRVVKLGTPRITARAPTPVRPPWPKATAAEELRAQPPQPRQQHLAGIARAAAEWAKQGAAEEEDGKATIVEMTARDGGGEQGRLGLQTVPASSVSGVAQQQQHQPFAGQAPAEPGHMPAEGFFVTGGESVFARSKAATGGLVARVLETAAPPPPPPRAALPADVRDAFRSTLAFIADPDGVRTQQQHQPPAWAALVGVEERREAQREAEELLGGAFDYAAIKRDLDRAKRASRLLQHAAGHVAAPPAIAGAGLSTPAAGGRRRPGAGTTTAVSAAAAPPPPLKAGPPRGDFVGLLPPPHSVWDVDEAWGDLDEFTKAVEAEVAHRAAAGAPASSGRSSPRSKHAGNGASATAPAAGQTSQAARSFTRVPAGGRAAQPGTAAEPAPAVAVVGQERTDTAGRSTSRKRAASPLPQAGSGPLDTAAADTSPSPPRAVRRTQAAAASGPVRVAFGRRVAEPPRRARETGTTKTRSISPPAGAPRGSPGLSQRPSNARRAAATSAPAPAAGLLATPPSPSSTGDAVQHVLSALASVLLSEGEDKEGDDNGRDRFDHDDGGAGSPEGADGGAPGRAAAMTRDAEAQADTVEVRAPPPASGPGNSAPWRQPWAQPESAAPGPPNPEQRPQPAPELSERVHPPPSDPDAVDPDAAMHGAPATPAGSGAATTAAAWLQPGIQSWPRTTLGTARSRFQYMIDTAHPPVSRLPAWAASAVAAEGAPTAYAAALGAAPNGLGFGTPMQRRPQPAAAQATPARPAAAASNAIGQPLPPQAGGGRNPPLGTSTSVLAFGDLPQGGLPGQQQGHQAQQKPPMFPDLMDLPSNTHVLPPRAAAVAASVGSQALRAGGRSEIDIGEQWEKALLQAVEDEVVARLALVQLAAVGPAPQLSQHDLPGLLPPLVDSDLSRRLVCDVLREKLRSLLVLEWQQQRQGQGQQGAAAAQGSEHVPSLEEVIAALVAAPSLPPRPQQQPQGQGIEQDAVTGAVVQDLLSPYEGRYDDAQEVGQDAACGDHGARCGPPGAADDASSSAAAGPDDCIAWPGAAAEGSGGNGAEVPDVAGGSGVAGQGVAMADAAREGEGEPGGSGDGATVHAGAAAPGAARAWQPVYAALRTQQQQQTSQATQAAPDSAAVDVHAYGQRSAQGVDAATGAPSSKPRLGSRDVPSEPQTVAPTVTARQEPGGGSGSSSTAADPAALTAAPSSGLVVQKSTTRSQAVQAYGVEARGVQAYAVVEARAVQAHGAEARGVQACGVQERGTQAAGVVDSCSQADPPPPHFLLQAALAAGLSYGAGPPHLSGILPGKGPDLSAAAQPLLGPDGVPLTTLPRPFYLVPADGSSQPQQHLLPPLGLYGAAKGLAVAPYSRGGEGSRPPLHLPGLSKLRDSSDVESSTDSMGRHLQGPGARARAAALEALRLTARGSLDSEGGGDDDLLQRSYAPLELAALIARPLQLQQHHRTESADPLHQQSTRAPGLSGSNLQAGSQQGSMAFSAGAQSGSDRSGGRPPGGASDSGGSGGLASGSDGVDAAAVTGGGAGSLRGGLDPRGHRPLARSGGGGAGAPTYLTQGLGPPSRTDSDIASQSARSEQASEAAGEDKLNTATASSHVSSFGASEQSGLLPELEQDLRQRGAVMQISTSMSGAESVQSASAASGGGGRGGTLTRGSSTGSPSAAASGASSGVVPTAANSEPATPAVKDDELVGDEDPGDFEGDNDDPGQIRSLHLGSKGGEEDDGVCGGVGEAAPGNSTLTAGVSRAGLMPMVGLMPAAAAAAAGGSGRRYGGGDGQVAEDFALSDDELLDEAEVARVLRDEDAMEGDEEEYEKEVRLEDAEEDEGEELRMMRGQQVTVLQDSEEEEQERARGPGAVSSARDDEAARAAAAADEVEANPEGGAEGAVAQAASLPQGVDGSNGDSRAGDDSGTLQPSPAAVASRVTSSRSSSGVQDALDEPSVEHIHGEMHTEPKAFKKQLDFGSGSGSDGVAREVSDEAALRASLERLALAGLAPLGRLQAAAAQATVGGKDGSSVGMRATASSLRSSGSGKPGAALLSRPGLAPLEPVSVPPPPLPPTQQLQQLPATTLTTASAAPGMSSPPDSPSRPPALATYRGPTRQLWRPPIARQTPQDPLLSSFESLMASSEASGPALGPLSRALLDERRRTRVAVHPGPGGGGGSSLAAVAERARALGLTDSVEESSLDVSASADSLLTSSMPVFPLPPNSLAGVTLPHQLARVPAASAAATTAAAATASTLQRGGGIGGLDSHGSIGSDADEEREATEGSERAFRGGRGAPDLDGGGGGASLAPGAGRRGGGGSRRDGAVFRLRQFGARRRKLMQQIGVQDPLLMSSPTGLSTDSSTVTVSDSEDGDGDGGYRYPANPAARGGTSATAAAMRRI